MANNNLVKGSSMRQKLQNIKGYAESPEFFPALGIIIFKKKKSMYVVVVCVRQSTSANREDTVDDTKPEWSKYNFIVML